jgi:hypothetical protein
MLAKASKLIPASHPGITAAEWQMAQQGGNFQEQVKQRQTQEAQEKSRAERERAQTAEEKRWHDMQYRMHMEAKKAASKTSPKELEDFEAMNRGLVATEKIKEAAKTNNPVLYSNVADNNIEDYAAGLNPGARQNPAIQKAEKDRMPGLGSKILGEGTDKSFNERHDAIRRNVRAALAAREDTPEYPGMLRIYAASEANVAAQHGRPVKMLLPGGKVPVAVPPANVEKEILAGGQVLR